MVKKILISFCLSAVALVATAQNEPYRNPDLSPSERAWDLLKRMTLEEKISQMKNGSPAIERLGIPAYDWWNEALHGVARAGKATVFPQAIIRRFMKPSASYRMKPVPNTMIFNVRVSGMVTRD